MLGKSFEEYFEMICAFVDLLPDGFDPTEAMADFEKGKNFVDY